MSIQELTDEQLCILLQELSTLDDQKQTSKVYAVLIDRYQTKLARYLVFLVSNDRENIEDIVQATFIKVYLNINRFDPKQKFSSWIYRIAHNEALDYVRKSKYLLPPAVANEVLEFTPDLVDNPELNLEKKERKLELIHAVNDLELKYREPLILYYFQDKNYDEIAEILQLSKSLVGVRIKRGKEKIKQILKVKNND